MELAFLLVLLMWVFHFRSSENVIPRYGLSCTCLSIWSLMMSTEVAFFGIELQTPVIGPNLKVVEVTLEYLVILWGVDWPVQ